MYSIFLFNKSQALILEVPLDLVIIKILKNQNCLGFNKSERNPAVNSDLAVPSTSTG